MNVSWIAPVLPTQTLRPPSPSPAAAPSSARSKALLGALAQVQGPAAALALGPRGPDVTTLAWVRAALASDAELVRAGAREGREGGREGGEEGGKCSGIQGLGWLAVQVVPPFLPQLQAGLEVQSSPLPPSLPPPPPPAGWQYKLQAGGTSCPLPPSLPPAGWRYKATEKDIELACRVMGMLGEPVSEQNEVG